MSSHVITDGRQSDDVRKFYLLEEYCLQGFDIVTSRAENSAFRLLLDDYTWFRAATIFTLTVVTV
jgi:hypothetical protein